MSDPFNLGSGRNGPAHLLGQQKPNALRTGKPYKPELAEEVFCPLGDVVVCTLAAMSEDMEVNGTKLARPEMESPYHVVLAVGPKAVDVTGHTIEIGDVILVEGGRRIETLAGSVWFARAGAIISVILPKAQGAPDA